MVRTKAVLTRLHIFKNEVARRIGSHRALCVLVRAMQHDLGIGDDCAGVVLDDPSNTSESGLRESGCDDIQTQKNGEDRKYLHANMQRRAFLCREESDFARFIAMNSYLV